MSFGILGRGILTAFFCLFVLFLYGPTITIVMGDFVTVRLMSGGQTASVGLMMMNAMSLLQYPAAAANAVVLLLLVLMTVGVMMRLVDIRKEL